MISDGARPSPRFARRTSPGHASERSERAWPWGKSRRRSGEAARRRGWGQAKTRIEQLMSVSNAGQLMPPKSTWFEPKLRSGLFLHAF
jgi:hypothetical protein